MTKINLKNKKKYIKQNNFVFQKYIQILIKIHVEKFPKVYVPNFT